jgi:creatinine amidohydrolase
MLDDLPWTDVDAYLQRGGRRLVVLLGSTENHGPHAPLGNDTIIARGVGSRVAKRLDALATPPTPFGFAAHHRSYPGSASLSNRTLATVLGEVVQGYAEQGFEQFAFLSGHGGNRVAIDLAVSELADAVPDATLVHARMLPLQTGAALREQVEAAYGSPLSDLWGAHGGEQETAAVMAERPELVRREVAPAPADVAAYLDATRDPAVTRLERSIASFTSHGTWGDARRATPEQGTLFLEHVADDLAARIVRLLPAESTQEGMAAS